MGVVDDGERADTGKNKIFGDFVAERSDVHKQDVGVANVLLRLKSPESDLTIV